MESNSTNRKQQKQKTERNYHSTNIAHNTRIARKTGLLESESKARNKTKTNIKHTNNKTNLKNWNRYVKNSQTLKQVGFEKGMSGRFVWKTEANIKKGNGKKTKTEQPPPQRVLQKGVDEQKRKRIDGIWKGRQKEKKKKQSKGFSKKENL